MQKPILVTSAGGQTGGAVARDLLSRGIPVRAFVRKPDDVAEVASALLASPTTPAGGSYSLVGDLPTAKGMIDIYSDVLGRKIAYVNVPDVQCRKMMGPYVDPYVLEHLADVLRFYRTATVEDESTFRMNDIVRTTTVHSPQTFRQFITANKDAFAAPSPEVPSDIQHSSTT